MHEADDASSTSARDPFVDQLLAQCHANYQETKNKYFMWQAIDFCSHEYWGHPTAIPDWCLPLLFEAAHEITAPIRKFWEARDTADAREPSGAEWRRILERIPGALGLSSKGRNQFRNAFAAMRRMQAGKAYHLARAAKGSSAKEALDEAKRAYDGNTAPGDRDPDEDRVIFAAVAKGVRLSTGGKAPPRKRSGKGKVTKPTP